MNLGINSIKPYSKRCVGACTHFLGRGGGLWSYSSLTHSLEEEKLAKAKEYDSLCLEMIPPSYS
jgi:hypothetical protein